MTTGIGNETKSRLNVTQDNIKRVFGSFKKADLSEVCGDNFDVIFIGTEPKIQGHTKVTPGPLESGTHQIVVVLKNKVNGSITKLNFMDVMAFILNNKQLP